MIGARRTDGLVRVAYGNGRERCSGFLEMKEDYATGQGLKEMMDRGKTKTAPQWAYVPSPRRARVKSPSSA